MPGWGPEPPTPMRCFVAESDDLVAYSAGRTCEGPQAAGFLAGPTSASVVLQHQDLAANDGTWDTSAPLLSPGYGLGRPMKIGKKDSLGRWRP